MRLAYCQDLPLKEVKKWFTYHCYHAVVNHQSVCEGEETSGSELLMQQGFRTSK